MTSWSKSPINSQVANAITIIEAARIEAFLPLPPLFLSLLLPFTTTEERTPRMPAGEGVIKASDSLFLSKEVDSMMLTLMLMLTTTTWKNDTLNDNQRRRRMTRLKVKKNDKTGCHQRNRNNNFNIYLIINKWN